MKPACIIMCLIFALFAYFQRNDLDDYNTQLWYVWVVLYGAVSAISLLSFFFALPRRFYISFCLSFLFAGIIRLNDLTPGANILFNDKNPAGNEGGGLIFVAIWFAVLAWKHPSFNKDQV